DDHLVADVLFLRLRNQFTIRSPDESSSGVMRLILAVARPELDVACPPGLVRQDGEARVLASAKRVLPEEVMRITPSGGLTRVRVVPDLEACGVRHQQDFSTAQGRNASHLGELVVVADHDADLA